MFGMRKTELSKTELAKWLLRFGLAFVFVYATIEIYINPQNFLKYTPKSVLTYVPLDFFLNAFGVVELAVAVWLVSGWKGEYPALLSFMMMVGIVAFNMEHFQVLFRNVAIAFGSLALVCLELEKIKQVPRKIITKIIAKLNAVASGRPKNLFKKVRCNFSRT